MSLYADLYLKLRNYEKKVGFDAQEHAYFYKGRTLTSMTKLNKKFFPAFDAAGISERLARNELGDVDYGQILNKAKELRASWKGKAALGTVIHDYAEHCLIAKSVDSFNPDLYITHPDFKNSELENYAVYSKVVQDFLQNDLTLFDRLLYTELVVWDSEFSVAGQVDFITYNADGSIDLWDWKTSSSITPEGVGFGKFGFGFLAAVPDTNYYHYALQLSGYAFILEKNLGLKVGKLRLVHIVPDGFKIITLPYMKDESYQILNSNKE
jgi:hypothetical protein